MTNRLKVSDEVAAALRERRAVVALESTLIAHGMPWPRNVETAMMLEAEVRALGAIPATIAVLDGHLNVGLTRAEIERLARGGPDVKKISRRDLAVVIACAGTGATTVAATMIIANFAGIRVFATGGIGGVHRGAVTTFDISADLQELARTPVAVVCAGAKAVLDLRLTLEYLETHGVPVVGYRCDRLPAFWSRDSGLRIDVRLDTPTEIAQVMQQQWQMGLTGGIVVVNPVPECFELPREEIERAIEQALEEARTRGIAGNALTPFLLTRLNALTSGDSLDSNVGLVLNNARLAAEVGTAYASLKST